MLKLKLQYFGYHVQTTDLLEMTPMLGKIEGQIRRGWQRVRLMDGITNLMDMSLSKVQDWRRISMSGMLQSMKSQRVRRD